MKTVTFEKLRCSEFYIRNLSALKQDYWDKYKVYSCITLPKPHNTLLLINDCDVFVRPKDGVCFEASKGDVLYMPTGAEYSIEFCNAKAGNIHSVVLHFNAFDETGDEIVFSNSDVTKYHAAMETVDLAFEAATEFLKQEYSPAKLYKDFYGILYEILKADNKREHIGEFFAIERRVDLLNDPECNLSIPEIAKKCMLSECYFRRLFLRRYGISPTKYRNECRINQAKKLLKAKVLSVTEVSRRVGFSDIYYFSKVFKETTGVSPKKYIEM